MSARRPVWNAPSYVTESESRFDELHAGVWPEMEAFIRDELGELVDDNDIPRLRRVVLLQQVRADWLTPCLENHEDLVMDVGFLDTKYEQVLAERKIKMERRKAEVTRREKDLGKSDKSAEMAYRLDDAWEDLAHEGAALERLYKFIRALTFSLKGRETVMERLSYRDRPE